MEPEKKSDGALIGSIIIILILILGGVFVWRSKVKEMQLEKKIQEENAAKMTEELNQIKQDLNTTDTNTGVDVNQIK
jgi:flagellar biosynthesis/type III secretory pathway M-ring protein FliF/YscJ